jgi:hypothetical protein
VRKLRTLLAGLMASILCLAAGSYLAGCGGGGSDGPQYALSVDAPADKSTAQEQMVLTGTGFLPPGSTCSGGCTGLLPPPVFGQLGPYTLGWRNESTGATHAEALTWVCNCGGGAPSWIAWVPVSPGANRITFTMSAGGYEQAVTVTVTRN